MTLNSLNLLAGADGEEFTVTDVDKTDPASEEEEVIEYVDEYGNPIDPSELTNGEYVVEEVEEDQDETSEEEDGDEDADEEDSSKFDNDEGASSEVSLDDEDVEYDDYGNPHPKGTVLHDDDDEEYDEDGNLISSEESELSDAEGSESEDGGSGESDEDDVDYSSGPKADYVTDGLDKSVSPRDASTEDQISNLLGMTSDGFTLRKQTISLSSILVTQPKKMSRQQSHKGLSRIVKELGILTPIHVMVSAEYQDALNAGRGETFIDGKYILIDGFRRLYAATLNQFDEIEAIVWQFDDPDKGIEVANILSLVLNKSQKRTWEEVWRLYGILEAETSMSPAALEYLLELNPGEAMKLKDVALASNYPEIWDDLTNRKKTLDQAYSALMKARREEEQYEMEDSTGVSQLTEDAEGIASEHGGGQLSEDETRELLELNGSGDEDLNFGQFEESEVLGVGQGELQSTSERKPLDPVLREAVLRRDNYTCQVCGLGKGILSGIVRGVAECHHTCAVYNQLDSSRDDLGMIAEGSDIPKLIVVDSTCHSLIHLVAIQEGKLGITKEEFDAMPEWEQQKWKNVAKYAKVLLWAEKKSGHKMKRDGGSLRREPKKPFWEISKENQEAEEIARKVAERGGRDYESDPETAEE